MPFLDYTGLATFWSKVKGILAGKQNSLTAGEGVSLENDTVDIQEPVKGITQAEYYALTEEQKNIGLYVVTDANINLNDHGDIYSTEETRIGTWIDGKPLYRRVIKKDNIIVAGGGKFTSIGLTGSELLIHQLVNGYWHGDFKERNFNMSNLIVEQRDDGGFYIVNNISEVDALMDVVVILEYTKTTDSAPTAQTTLLTSNIDLPQTMTLTSSSVASDSPLTVTFPIATAIASASASSVHFTFTHASASSANLTL